MTEPEKSSRESGFTLVEVLIALGLFGLILAILAGALNISLKGAQGIEAASGRMNEIRSTQTLLRRHLEAARPDIWTEDERSRIAFDGQAGGLSFIALLPPWGVEGGPYRVHFALDGDSLVMTRRIDSGIAPGFDFSRDAQDVVLLQGVRALRFSYFGVKEGGQNPQWTQVWQGGTTLPRLIRVEADLAGASRASWPDLTIAPVIGARPR